VILFDETAVADTIMGGEGTGPEPVGVVTDAGGERALSIFLTSKEDTL
jgi:hypothetical protein